MVRRRSARSKSATNDSAMSRPAESVRKRQKMEAPSDDDLRNLLLEARGIEPEDDVAVDIGESVFAIPKSLLNEKVKPALLRAFATEEATRRSSELLTFPVGKIFVGKIFLHWLATGSAPRVEDVTAPDPDLDVIEDPCVTYSINLIKTWAFGEQYGLVDFQNAVMFQLLRTLDGSSCINPEIAITAYKLDTRQAGYKVRSQVKDASRSPIRVAVLNAALLAWDSSQGGSGYEDSINALAKHRECLSDLLEAVARYTLRMAGSGDSVYGFKFEYEGERDRFMLAEDCYDQQDGGGMVVDERLEGGP